MNLHTTVKPTVLYRFSVLWHCPECGDDFFQAGDMVTQVPEELERHDQQHGLARLWLAQKQRCVTCGYEYDLVVENEVCPALMTVGQAGYETAFRLTGGRTIYHLMRISRTGRSAIIISDSGRVRYVPVYRTIEEVSYGV